MHGRIIIRTLVPFLALGTIVLLSGCLTSKPKQYATTLEIWGVFDASDAYEKVFQEYRKINPFIRDINYRKLVVDNYRQELLDALAAGKGPDIFMLHNTWLPSFEDKIVPVPDRLVSEQEYRQNFVDVAIADFLKGGKIYAVPLSIDSLGLYYNKDILNAAGITEPPKTWEEFTQLVRKLTRRDRFGTVTLSGAAIGTASNVNRATDILSLFMIQSGTQMTDSQYQQATFDRSIAGPNQSYISSGEDALNFYTSFASSSSPNYAWNSRMHYSIDAFYEGSVAMMINYSYHLPTIRAKNERLNFAVAPIPQTGNTQPANFANYWGFAVTKNKLPEETGNAARATTPIPNDARTYEAWEFLKFFAMRNPGAMTITNSLELLDGKISAKQFPVSIDPAALYLETTGKPAARRDLLEKQKSDPVLGPFAYGNLIARSWHQADPQAIEGYFNDMITSVNLGESSAYDAIRLAANRVTQLMR